MLLDIELLEHNDYLPKKDSMFGSVLAFPMYGGLGMSTPSLHRESTASLMIFTLVSLVFLAWPRHSTDLSRLGSLNAIPRNRAIYRVRDRRGVAGRASAADVDHTAHILSTKWRLIHPETPVELSVSLFDSFGEYICSKGSI